MPRLKAQSGTHFVKKYDNYLRRLALTGDRKCAAIDSGTSRVTVTKLARFYPEFRAAAHDAMKTYHATQAEAARGGSDRP